MIESDILNLINIMLLFQCDVTDHYIAMKARDQLFIDQGRTTLYWFWYIGQYCSQSHVLVAKCMHEDRVMCKFIKSVSGIY